MESTVWSPQCGRSRQSDILEGFDADVDLVCKSHVAPQKTRRVCRVGVWFGFIRSALLLAVVVCWVDCCFDSWVLLFLLCFLRLTRGMRQMPGTAKEGKSTTNPGTTTAKPIRTCKAPCTKTDTISLHDFCVFASSSYRIKDAGEDRRAVNSHALFPKSMLMSHVHRDAPTCTR